MSQNYRVMLMQSLLPGLTHAAQTAVEQLNEARQACGLPPIDVNLSPHIKRRGRPRKSSLSLSAATPEPEPADAKPAAAPARSHRKKTAAAEDARLSTAERWQMARAAGLHPKTVPNAAMMDKARRILAKRGPVDHTPVPPLTAAGGA